MDKSNRQIASDLGQDLGIDLFSLEYEILTLLHESGDLSHKELSGLLRPSSATLERRLAWLRTRGLVTTARDRSDLRRCSYALSDDARSVLESELAFFSSWPKHAPISTKMTVVR